jgi:hypothetical protein
MAVSVCDCLFVTVRLNSIISHSDVSAGDLYTPDPVEQLLAPATSRYQNPCFENRLTFTLCSLLHPCTLYLLLLIFLCEG